MHPVRRRVENSARLARWLGNALGAYLAFCHRTTRWKVVGLDDMKADLAQGPVLYLLWHSRSLLGPAHWPADVAPLTSLHDGSPIGRVGGQVQRYFGLTPVQMSGITSTAAASRLILSRLREGCSIGMVGDGPTGPARVLNSAAADWARVAKRPVWAYAFSTTRGRRAKSWDKQLIPLPFGHGAIVFFRFPQAASRDNRAALSKHLDTATAQADAMCGRPPGP